ncbi:MAG TPA: HemK2/MTQ2 family protein methyltransferase [Candidatus Limnocylindrales bacterium]|nr:HemK2/MTQ2 family protein methyltransferase [Candidatus Limnocylindrales bacterium]
MQSPVKRAQFGKYVFGVWDNVYEPAEDSFLFAEKLDVEKGAQVLDVGTGCGILGIVAAEKAAAVIAVDLNPFAIRCAKENSVLNNVFSRMAFVQADLLTVFDDNATFDLILFNAPYLPAAEHEAETWIGRSWAGGVDGRQVIDRFISQVQPHLKTGGRVLLLQSTLANVEETICKFGEHRLKARVKAEQQLPFFETLVLIEAKY